MKKIKLLSITLILAFATGSVFAQKKSSAFRIQIGVTTGVQTNPIGTDAIIQDDVTKMSGAVNAANAALSSSSADPVATVDNVAATIYAIPVGFNVQTVILDFLRIRLGATYDIPLTTVNQYTDKSSGATDIRKSEITVTQIQVPLLFMFDVPLGDANTIYFGGGPTAYWGSINKKVTHQVGATGVTNVDEDKIEGLAFGPSFIIGIQRRFGSMLSISGDILFQSGARGGFRDKTQNAESNNDISAGTFGDLNGNSGVEKLANGKFNPGSSRIMNYDGIRLLVSANFHLDL